MRVALTGATGFIGRYIVEHLSGQGHQLRCWHRAASNRKGFEDNIGDLEWIEGDLGDPASATALVEDCDAVVHAALYRPGAGFRGAEGDLIEFVQNKDWGSFHFGYVHGNMDCQLSTREGVPAVEWSWDGNDEMDAAQGRGWAVLENDALQGAIFFHGGDSSGFVAKKNGPPPPKSKKGRR